MLITKKASETEPDLCWERNGVNRERGVMKSLSSQQIKLLLQIWVESDGFVVLFPFSPLMFFTLS